MSTTAAATTAARSVRGTRSGPSAAVFAVTGPGGLRVALDVSVASSLFIPREPAGSWPAPPRGQEVPR